MSTSDDGIPVAKGTYPNVILGAGQWVILLSILEKRGTKGAASLAKRIRSQVFEAAVPSEGEK